MNGSGDWTPSGLASPDGSPDAAVGRFPSPRPGASPVPTSRLRRLLGWETLIVLAIFPVPATISALYYLALHLDRGVASSAGYVLPHETATTVVLTLLARVAEVAAAALVLYLLTRSGEGIGTIGLGRGRVRRDLALLLPVWYLTQVFPQDIGHLILDAARLPTYTVLTSVPEPLLIGVAVGVVAGVVEEVVVLGYLVRRLEQRGWSPTWVVIVAVAVRVSYHLYYGPGAIPIALWALATVIFYRRVRRLAPFIICHVVWDVRISLAHQSLVAGNLAGGIFVITAFVLFLRWRSWVPAGAPPPGTASGAAWPMRSETGERSVTPRRLS